MAKKNKNPPQYDLATLQPTELNELKTVVKEFLTRNENLDNEINSLKEAKKELLEEFSTKLDIKTLNQAIKVLQIEATTPFKHTFDSFYEILKDDYVNNLTNG